MDARRLTAPLVAAGLLRRRPAAPPPDAVRETLADARLRELRVDGAATEATLYLPAGAGPHPVVVLTTAAAAAWAERLAAEGVAALPLAEQPTQERIGAIAAALAGRIDVNPHEIGVVVADAEADGRLTELPHIAFVIACDPDGLAAHVIARVTIPA